MLGERIAVGAIPPFISNGEGRVFRVTLGQAKRDTEHALRCGQTYLFYALA